MKKILVISNTAFSIEKFREHYLSRIYGYHFDIYTPNNKAKLKKNHKNLNIHVFNSKNIIQDFISIYKILKKEKPKKVLVYSYKYQLILSLIKKYFLFDFNQISILAGRGSYDIGNFFYRKIYIFILKFILAQTDLFIAINPKDKKYFQFKSNNKKVYSISTEGVNENKILIKKNNQKNFGFFGRLIKEKGILDYIKVAELLKKKYPNLNFYIAGPSSQKVIGQSKFNAKTLNLIKKNNKSIKYLGYEKSYKDFFPKLDCLISPSYSEGAGTSVMEAMMSGLFVIGYKNSGHNYVMGKTGNFICNKNNVDDLLNKIEKFLKLSKVKISKIKKKSRNKVLINFTAKKVASEFKLILNKFENKINSKNSITYSSNLSLIDEIKFFSFKYLLKVFNKPHIHNLNKSNIIHITRSFEKNKYGGIQEVIKQISKFSRFNHIVLSCGKKNIFFKNQKNLNSFIFKRTFTTFSDIFSINLLKFLIRYRSEYNIIHIHYPHPLAYLYLLLLPFKKKIIVTHHSDIMKVKFLNFFIKNFRINMDKYVDKYHISSETYFKNSEINKFKNKTLIEFFSIEKDKLQLNKSKNYIQHFRNKKFVLLIARNSYYKGFKVLSKIIRELEDVNFICVTDYKFKKDYKNLLILKNISEIQKTILINKSRLVISTSTSRAESFGMTILEAIINLKPVMSFDLQTGVNDLIKNDKNGYLIKKFDVTDYKNKILKIYNDDLIYKSFCSYQKKHKKMFSMKYKKLEKLYAKLNN